MDVHFRHHNKHAQRSCFSARRLIVIFSSLLVMYLALTAAVYIYAQRGPFGTQKQDTGVVAPLDSGRKPQPPPQPIKEDYADRKRKELESQHGSEIDSIINLSNQYKADRNWTLSLEVLDKGLAKFPWSDRLATYKGGWHYDQGNWTGAEMWYKKAHELNRQEVMYVMNVALCLVNQHKEAEAVYWYQLGYDMKPSIGQLLALSSLLHKFNNWTNYEENQERILKEIREEIDQGRWVSINSFVALHYPFNLYEIQQIAASAAKRLIRDAKNYKVPDYVHDPVKRRSTGNRIRIGYVSYDLRQHAVGVQIQSIFGFHNKSRYEVWAYNVNDGKRDSFAGPVNDKIRREVEHYVDMGSMPLPEATKRIFEEDKIDVLVDCGLYTAYARMDLFTVRPAPIQVAWLGLATTTGAPWMDYVVGDPVVTPHSSAKYYTEKLAVMPHSYHAVDHRQSYEIKPEPDRKSRGYPADKFLFCNHANNIRLNPEIFNHWATIVKRSPNSVLVLKHFNDEATKNLKMEAKKRGLIVSDNVEETQVMFQHGIGGGEHIQVKSMCDLYLDCHWYNGHSTTADMLWAGVPLVTYPGETMASRAAASFITSTGVPTDRMIANSWEDYINKAVDMAQNRNTTTKQIREQLRATRMTQPFFDTPRWVRNFERAVELMFQRYMAGKAPDHVYVIDNE